MNIEDVEDIQVQGKFVARLEKGKKRGWKVAVDGHGEPDVSLRNLKRNRFEHASTFSTRQK
jgi:hypothetical protein